jgi:hypothetical protein
MVANPLFILYVIDFDIGVESKLFLFISVDVFVGQP